MKTLLLSLLSLGIVFSALALNPPGEPLVRENPKENYPHYKKLLHNPPSGTSREQIAKWFGDAFRLLSEMNEPQEFDLLLNLAAEKYADNVPVMIQLYDSANFIPSYGYRIGGKFVRGNNRGGYGEYLSCAGRDRVFLLRMYEKIYKQNPDSLPGDFHARFAGLWLTDRNGGSSWKLQEKTDLSALPEYSAENGQFSYPPVNDDGMPVFYRTPESYESSVNDGERFQFFRQKARERKSTFADKIYADFLRGQFGNSPYNRWAGVSKEERSLLANLSDDETIARLADGILRFRMPEEHNFIRLYRAIGDRKALAQIYLNRFQYDKALAEFRALDDKPMIEQLSGNLGSLDPIRVQPAGSEPVLKFIYRNAKAGDVAIRRIEEKPLFDALLAAHSKAGDRGYNPFYSLPVEQLLKYYSKTLGAEIAKFPLTLNPLPRYADTEQEIRLPLKESGAYLVTITLKDGNTSQIIVWITDYVLSMNTATGQPARLLLNRAADGVPVPGTTVQLRFFRTVYAQKPADIKKYERVRMETRDFTETSAPDGSLPIPSVKDMNLFWAYAWIGGKPAFYSGTDYFRSGNQRQPDAVRAFMITSRPIYKPGDKVEFSGFLRRAAYGGDTGEYPDSVTVKVAAPRGKTLYTARMPVSRKTGAFAGVFRLPDDATLGGYRIICEKFGSIAFRAEEYKKPEYEVKIDLPSASVRLGETVTATLRADYYFGAPVPDAEVRCRVYREIAQPYFPVVFRFSWLYGDGYELPSTCYLWMFRPWFSGEELVAELSGRTGADGRFPIRINTAISDKQTVKNYRYRIQAEVTDSSRKVISASGSLIAAAKPFNLFLYARDGFCRVPDGVTRLRIAAFDPNGKPVEGAGLIKIYRAKLSPNLQYENDGKAIRTIRFRSGDEPSFVLNTAGVYRAVAEFNAKDGGKDTASCIVRVLDSGRESGMFSELPIELSLDKPIYQPGDTAQILISANRPDADVYFFFDGKMKHLKLDGYSALVTHTITEKDRPNLFAAALTIRDGRLYSVTQQLCIPPENRMLNVKLGVPETDVRPRTTVPVDLTVTDADGNPVSGAFALTVYDKSLEALAGNNVPMIQRFFWNWKRWFRLNSRSGADTISFPYYPGTPLQRFFGDGVRYYEGVAELSSRDMNGMVLGKAAKNDMPLPASAPIARGESAAVAGGSEESFVRSDFADSIFWIGQRRLGGDGRVRILVPVPDNLTTWVVRAWSIGDRTSVGEGRAEFVVSKEIIARLEIPPFLTAGDTADALAIVHNYTKKTIRAAVNLSCPEDTVSIPPNGGKTCEIKPEQSVTVPFRIRANRAGNAAPVLSVNVDGRLADAVSLSLPVRVRGIQKHVPAAGRLRNQIARVEYFVPQIRRNSAEMTISVTPGAAVAMADLLPVLAAEETSDVFGVVTRFLPALKASRALAGLNLPLDVILRKSCARARLYADYLRSRKLPESGAALDKQIIDNLKMIQGMVNSDGGWGWFSGYGESSYADTTAFVVDALLEAKEMKLGVDPNILTRGIDWLVREAEGRVAVIKRSKSISNVDSLLIRTLAKAGKRPTELDGLVYQYRAQLSPLGLATLGLALKDGTTEQATVIRELERLLKRDPQAGTAYLNIPTRWRFSWAGSETAAQAAYLELLLRTAPKSDLTEAVARYLTMNLRNAPSRTSTRALGEAVGALARYIRISGEADPELDVMIKLDEGHIKSFRITKENMWDGDFTAKVPPEMLYPGKHILEISCAGRGAVYYQTMLTYFSLEPRIGAAGLDLKLNRRYFRIEQESGKSAVPDRRGQLRGIRTESEKRVPLADLSSVRPGDIVEVELIAETKNDYDYVEFRDRIPAGFEYVKPQSGYISWYPSIYAEFAAEGPRFYLRNLTRGDAGIRYRIRARFDGTYTALPATGKGVYAPELRANSSDTILIIKEK